MNDQREEIRDGLILLPPEEEHWILGSKKATVRFGGVELNQPGNWTPWQPRDEEQNMYGLETMNCTNYGTLKAWMVLAKFLGFTDFMQDSSERYTGVHTNTSPTGNDPHHVAEIIRLSCGLVPQEVMPWHADIDSWDEYYDERMADSLLPLGRKLLERFEFGHEWIFAWGNTLSPAAKAAKLKEALKHGPVCVSVRAWKKKGRYYVKDVGTQDTHWTLLLRYDGDNAVVHDQYAPFIKTLAKDYDFNAAKVYFLKRRELNIVRTFWDSVLDNFTKLWKF